MPECAGYLRPGGTCAAGLHGIGTRRKASYDWLLQLRRNKLTISILYTVL